MVGLVVMQKEKYFPPDHWPCKKGYSLIQLFCGKILVGKQANAIRIIESLNDRGFRYIG